MAGTAELTLRNLPGWPPGTAEQLQARLQAAERVAAKFPAIERRGYITDPELFRLDRRFRGFTEIRQINPQAIRRTPSRRPARRHTRATRGSPRRSEPEPPPPPLARLQQGAR